jgi:hypothetical protein
MADPTTAFGWDLPTVGGASGTWGTQLNTIFQDIDDDLASVQTTAGAALPKAGGAMTGRLDAHSGTLKLVAKGSISGAQSLDLSAANYFTMTITGSTTISVSNVPSGTWATGLILRIVNGGSNITWPAAFKFPGGTAPVLTTSGTDMLAMVTDDSGTTWRQVGKTLDVR